jgi:hypothetical protein
MTKSLTGAEIDKRFNGEWVLLGNPKMDKHFNVLGAVVLCHSKNRDVVYRKAMALKPKHSAVFYVGTPKGRFFAFVGAA